jgi:hypothetical protein
MVVALINQVLITLMGKCEHCMRAWQNHTLRCWVQAKYKETDKIWKISKRG